MNKESILISRIFIFWLIVLVSFSCSKKSEQEAHKIRVGYLPIIAHLPALIAQEQGFLNDIPVEFHVYGTSNDLLSALQNEEIDATTAIAVAPVAQVSSRLISSQKTIPIHFFSYSMTTKGNPFDGIYVQADSRIRSLADLTGKKIGVFPGTTAKNICKYFLEHIKGINANTITWVNLPPNVQVDALIAGDIDALYTYEPTATIAKLNNVRELYGSVVADVQEGAPYGGSAISKDFEKRNPKLSKSFIEAMDRAILFVRENESSSRLVLERRLGLPKNVASRCNLEYRHTSKEIVDTVNIRGFQEFLEKLVEMREIEASIQANLLVRDQP